MVIGTPLQHPHRNAGRGRALSRILALTVIFILVGRSSSQQSTPSRNNARPTSNTSSPFLEAETLLRQGSVEEAKQRIEEQLKLNPSSVEGYNLLGIAYSSEKDYDNALKALQQALTLDPNSTRTHNNLGNLYVSQEKVDLAENEFGKVLRVDPTNREANYNLGLVLMARHSPAAAILQLQRVRPADVATRFNLVRAYLQAGRTAEGLTMARALSAQNKDDVQLHFTLGALLGAEKQYSAGQLELERANALQPETFEILFNLGQAYLRGGNYTKAEVVLNRALKLNPESAATLASLAQVDSGLNRPVDALDLLARAHKLAPEDTNIILLLARLSMAQSYFEDATPLLESGLRPLRSSRFWSTSIPRLRPMQLWDFHTGTWDALTSRENLSSRASNSIPATLLACSTWATSRSGRGIRRPPNGFFSKPSSRIRTSPKRCWSWPI